MQLHRKQTDPRARGSVLHSICVTGDRGKRLSLKQCLLYFLQVPARLPQLSELDVAPLAQVVQEKPIAWIVYSFESIDLSVEVILIAQQPRFLYQQVIALILQSVDNRRIRNQRQSWLLCQTQRKRHRYRQ